MEYALNHVCGHASRFDLVGPPDKREAEVAWLESQPCRACRRLSPPPVWPPLEGLPGQVLGAEPLRDRAMQEVCAQLDTQIDSAEIGNRRSQVARARRATPNIRKWSVVADSLGRITLAQWWITNRTATLPQLVRAAMRDGFMPEWFADD